jgi:hypothetical protein
VCSGSHEVAPLRRDRFLTANIPGSVHRPISRVKLARNLRKSRCLQIQLLFVVARQANVTVRQTRDLTRERTT